MLNKPHITDTESKMWTKCLDSVARVHNAGNFLYNLNFFHFLPEKYFVNMLTKLHITDTESKIWFNSPDSDAQVYKAGNVCANP
jgi:hypothetical protein